MTEAMKLHPELEESYTLGQDQVEKLQADGHILLKGLASHSVIDQYRPVILEEVARLNQEKRPLAERDTYGKAFLQIENIWVQSERVKQFAFAKRFAKVAAELMGVSGVRMYHDQALFKEPGGGHTPWHQDQIYWPVDTDNTITMWMPLVDIPAEVGSMTFATGSHKRGYVSKLEISDHSHKTLAQYIEGEQIPTHAYGAMKAGDATFHYGWTMHCAPGNPTQQTREVMTVIYIADGCRVIEPDTKARQNDIDVCMTGLEPGDIVDSPLNPLLYSAK